MTAVFSPLFQTHEWARATVDGWFSRHSGGWAFTDRHGETYLLDSAQTQRLRNIAAGRLDASLPHNPPHAWVSWLAYVVILGLAGIAASGRAPWALAAVVPLALFAMRGAFGPLAIILDLVELRDSLADKARQLLALPGQPARPVWFDPRKWNRYIFAVIIGLVVAVSLLSLTELGGRLLGSAGLAFVGWVVWLAARRQR